MRFYVDAARARKRNAIGLFFPLSIEIKGAADLDDAERRFRTEYEAHGVMIEAVPNRYEPADAAVLRVIP